MNDVRLKLIPYVLYVIAIVLAVSTRGLYTFTYYKDNVLMTYYRRTQIIYKKKLPQIKPKTRMVSFIRYRCSTLSEGNDRCNDFERIVVKTGQCFTRCFTRYHILLRKNVLSRIFVKVFCVTS